MKVSYIRPAYARVIFTADIDDNDFAEWYNDTISDEPYDISDITGPIIKQYLNDKINKIEDTKNAELVPISIG